MFRKFVNFVSFSRWSAVDASEPGDPTPETFAVRFKTNEIAQNFLQAVKESIVSNAVKFFRILNVLFML